MEQLLQGGVKTIVDQGLLGVMLAASMWVIWRLYNKIDMLQERRVEEHKALIVAVNESTANMEKLAEAVKKRDGN